MKSCNNYVLAGIARRSTGDKLIAYLSETIPNKLDWPFGSLLDVATHSKNQSTMVAIINAHKQLHGHTKFPLIKDQGNSIRMAIRQNNPKSFLILLAGNVTLDNISLESELNVQATYWNSDSKHPILLSCYKMLTSNGYLPTINPNRNAWSLTINYTIRDYRKRFVNCRAACIILLGIKRRRQKHFIEHDRFIIKELALAIYTTRDDKMWNP